MKVSIFVKAEDVSEIRTGIFNITLEVKEMNEAQLKMMMECFPNLSQKAYELFYLETLFANVVHDLPPAEKEPVQPVQSARTKEKWKDV